MSPRGLQPEVISAVVAAMQAAGATEEMVAAAVGVAGGSPNPPSKRPGRPRKYQSRAEGDRAYYERRKREKAQTLAITRVRADLKGRLIEAAHHNVDASADVGPILYLLDQGCDLEADVLPIVALELPELPRPLRNWGAPWLVREILANRDSRLGQFADRIKGAAASATQ
jgi:hypothetical protein